MTSTDRQLLFGVLALQLELITVDQFVEVCTIWASKKDRSLPDLLFDRGWLQAQDRSDIDRLLTRKVQKHGGDVAASLREAGKDPRVQLSMHNIGDEDILHSLVPTPPPHGVAIVATREFVPDGQERYTLSRLHAMGGIGRVWLAHDVALRREVALKELRPERASSDVVIGRFLREARITGQLEHPGIVPIYEVGRRPDDQAPYYTMRFIRGQTMAEAAADYHRRRKAGEAKPIELRKLVSSFVGVCNAVAYAHSRGVLHRDLKPQNIVLGAFGEVIVLDWGLAKVNDEQDAGPTPLDLGSEDGLDETRLGDKLGTPPYMSPEQAAGLVDDVGPATDVFGLGAVLYHLLTNQPPFPAKDHKEAIAKAAECRPTPVLELVPEVSPALEAVCLKALSKKQENRYESPTALADEVQHWLADEPVQAYPEPASKRTVRWMRRHKTFVSAAAVFLVCSTIAMAGATAMIWREQQQTERDLERTYSLVRYVMETADTELVYQNTLTTRRKLIERGLQTINEIHIDRPNDPKVASMLGELQRYWATVLSIGQDYDKAIAVLREAISVLEPLVARFPDDEANQIQLARVHFQLSSYLKLKGRREEAIAEAERSVRQSEGPAARGNLDAKFNLAVALNELSISQYGFLPMETTEKTAQRAVDALEDVVKEFPPTKTLSPRLFMSGALLRIANCRREMGRPSEALGFLDAAGRILQQLGVSHPKDTDVVHVRGIYFLVRGRTLAAIPGKEKEALDALDQAIGIWTAMGAAKVDRHWISFAAAHAWRATLHQRKEHLKEAEADLSAAEKALAPLTSRSGGNADYHFSVGLTAAWRTRLALKSKDAAGIQKHFAAAQAAYRKLLEIDPHHVEGEDLAKLEAEVKAAKN
jgi:eukaryotic-like serine/threonine-protein kinase